MLTQDRGLAWAAESGRGACLGCGGWPGGGRGLGSGGGCFGGGGSLRSSSSSSSSRWFGGGGGSLRASSGHCGR